MTRIPVNPELLRWARERSGLAQEDLATKFKKLPDWEDGEAQPTLKQVEAFARACTCLSATCSSRNRPRNRFPFRISAPLPVSP